MKVNPLVSRVLMFAVVLFGLLTLSQPAKVKAAGCISGHNCVGNHKVGRCGGPGGCLCIFKDGTSIEDTIDCALL